MNNLEQFLFKNVKVRLINGEEINGVVVAYWSADEAEDKESIGISESQYSHDGIGLSLSEIASIEEREKDEG